MIRAGLAALVMLVVMSGNGWAEQQFYTGNTLFEVCNSPGGSCSAYIIGVFDAMNLMNGNLAGCAPKGVTGGQVTDVAKKFLADHPERRHFGAASLVAVALSEAFPCPP